MTKHTHTPEQAAILWHLATTDLDLIIDAKAGCGKTSSIIDSLPSLRGSTVINAFNKSIVDEINVKIDKLQLPFSQRADINICTSHSLGFAALRQGGGRLKVETNKKHDLLKEVMNDMQLSGEHPLYRTASPIVRAVSAAKAAGFGLTSAFETFPSPTDPINWENLFEHFRLDEDLSSEVSLDFAIEVCQRLFNKTNQVTHLVDFDDMIYLPLLLNKTFHPYSNVVIDEAQDINATRRELAFRSLAPSGRLIVVGDPNQAIYAFTGADSQSMDNIARNLKQLRGESPTVLPLTTCWRCDANIIAQAQKYVPAIQARSNAAPGTVRRVRLLEADDDEEGTAGTITLDEYAASLSSGTTVLCRLNNPLLQIAFRLIKRRQPVQIEGRDIGQQFLNLYKRAVPKTHMFGLNEGMEIFNVWLDKTITELTNINKHKRVAELQDKAEALEVLVAITNEATTNPNYNDLQLTVNKLFGDQLSASSVVLLSSIHKSKGREWPKVHILGFRDYLPFFLAESDWELEAEDNLAYVAITRAEHELTLVNGVKAALDAARPRQASAVKA